MTDLPGLPDWLFSYESTIAEKFSQEAKDRGWAALVADGASAERAREAIDTIARACASYIAAGPVKTVPDSEIKAEIAAIAKAAEDYLRQVNRLSPQASGVLLHLLRPPRRGLLSWARMNLGNPDPLYEEPPPGLSGLQALGAMLTRKIKHPADMGAKFQRTHSDFFELAPRLREASRFPARRGRPRNWRAHQLFANTIEEWADASGQAPTGSQRAGGLVDSALLSLLRDLVWPTTDHEEVREALSDAVFLTVLRDMKQHGRNILSGPIPGRRRRGVSADGQSQRERRSSR